MRGLGEAVMIFWAEVGLKIEKTTESTEELVIYVSVPEHSHEKNANGEEMAGMALAKQYKTAMIEMGIKRLTVKARVRAGEMWTKEMGEAAKLEMLKAIYKSQY